MAGISPSRERMIEDMTVRNLAQATQQSYLYAVAKFSRYFRRSPDKLGPEEVRAYQLHLADQKFSWTHINQVACALRFFYGITLGQEEASGRIVNGREPSRLPTVLSPEVGLFLDAVSGLRNRMALMTAYAAGLRVGEVARLKVSAIDSRRMLIHVENGKGGRERYTMLSASYSRQFVTLNLCRGMRWRRSASALNGTGHPRSEAAAVVLPRAAHAANRGIAATRPRSMEARTGERPKTPHRVKPDTITREARACAYLRRHQRADVIYVSVTPPDHF